MHSNAKESAIPCPPGPLINVSRAVKDAAASPCHSHCLGQRRVGGGKEGIFFEAFRDFVPFCQRVPCRPPAAKKAGGGRMEKGRDNLRYRRELEAFSSLFQDIPPGGRARNFLFFVSAHEVPSFLKARLTEKKRGKRRGIMTGGGGEITPGYETYGEGRG